MRKPVVLLLGGPNSGKTHYAGQLYGRLQRKPGMLKLNSNQTTPPNLSALGEVLGQLENGNSAEHTPSETWSEITLNLVDDQGQELQLNWPDYGGEQLKEVFKNREVPENWRNKLLNADGWFVLIRLSSETVYSDAIDKLKTGVGVAKSSSCQRAVNWDANAYWIETFQILKHVAGLDSISSLTTPRLAILLSCYDELTTTDQPPLEVLKAKLPLFESYLSSTWHESAISIWGLSSLGKSLGSSTNDDDFIDEGPEYHGWVCTPDGKSNDGDLTKPLAWLLKNYDD
ncbi:TRAFAC clade GTPase domain-containing protein [Celerinatantimonas diazotrophica]|uniref:Double-GTPase 1 domain-containing protein n=1 Tax=Celerinatantimonas diazotrophica TaxID=412034 RepID=A0A4R1K1A7_9GAMM|nr:hypothetical protein [Celerinatantimonas diazotrophica]TCK57754.1 hypothetical protein EV690_1448 [Celerinatantimonas diazotrophica]CAG9298184.1 hypothetical protein CEDIAZO_03379 [Celerinatantimonas diazotrophica]